MTATGDHPDDGRNPRGPVDAEVLDGAAAESALPPDAQTEEEPADQPAPPPEEVETEEPESPLEQAERVLAERTLDLQRLQAEYVNYKRRVDRDRDLVRGTAMAGVLTSLVPVLDDIDRARSHGELTGGFKAVSESLERVLTGLGLLRYGEPGEPFDPRVHEALTHGYSDEVSVSTAQTILQPGYRIGERIIRPAMVAVIEPSEDSPQVVDDADQSPEQVSTEQQAE
ncbi:MAG: nucleotide exchange factor GrpE [Actinomycetota bacterium]|nr:nucleotide exchange factor GrpE [Actinomycetota bacterium]